MWTQGRQGGGYSKWTLFQLWKRLDLHVLKIEPGAVVPVHRDQVPSGRHWRINLTIFGGGTLLIRRGKRWGKTRRAAVAFEPGALDHAYQNGSEPTYQVSLGWRV